MLTAVLGSVCEFMLKQTKERQMPWLLMIASNTVAELHKLRYYITLCHTDTHRERQCYRGTLTVTSVWLWVICKERQTPWLLMIASNTVAELHKLR